jgi:hypothetical protein
MRKRLSIVLVCAAAAALSAAPAAIGGVRLQGPRGYLLVTFSGTGGGGYRFHTPPAGAGAACRQPDTTYAETDSYNWSYTFLVSPTGGSGGAPFQESGGGQISSTEQTLRCAGDPAAATTCSEQLRTPPTTATTDVAYPDVNVALSGRQVTVGALGELTAAAPATCAGGGTLLPNLIAGWAQLQGSVTFPRALLLRPDGYSAPFTMSGAGLYDGVALSGQCSSRGCDATTCAEDLPAGPGAPTSCAYDEDYTGTIDIRVLR